MVADHRKYARPQGPGKTFQQFIEDAVRKGGPTQGRESLKWMANYARGLRISGTQVMRNEQDKYRNRPSIGSMMLFFYDPKLKDKLPYYDRFPCIFVVDVGPGYFYGLNLHYLPPSLRVQLMDALYSLESGRLDENKKLNLSYQILKGASKYRFFRPCFKKYLLPHVRSRFVKVPYSEWALSAMLPTQNFEKKSYREVWKDSQRMLSESGRGRRNR